MGYLSETTQKYAFLPSYALERQSCRIRIRGSLRTDTLQFVAFISKLNHFGDELQK
jgi:hypothetical protein